MRELTGALDASSILIALLLMPSTVSAPVVVSPLGRAHTAVDESLRDCARTLYQLRREESNLALHRELALADEKHLTVDVRSSRLRMRWGTALLKECSFRAHGVDKVRAGLVSVSSMDVLGSRGIGLGNGVVIHRGGVGCRLRGSHVALESEDFDAVIDFVDVGSKVIWQF